MSRKKFWKFSAPVDLLYKFTCTWNFSDIFFTALRSALELFQIMLDAFKDLAPRDLVLIRNCLSLALDGRASIRDFGARRAVGRLELVGLVQRRQCRHFLVAGATQRLQLSDELLILICPPMTSGVRAHEYGTGHRRNEQQFECGATSERHMRPCAREQQMTRGKWGLYML